MAAFLLNAACCFANKRMKHIEIVTRWRLRHPLFAKRSTELCVRQDKVKKHRPVFSRLWRKSVMLSILCQQEAQLLQTDRETSYVSWNLVNCCTAVRNITFEIRTGGGWHWRSLKVIGIAAVRWAIIISLPIGGMQ